MHFSKTGKALNRFKTKYLALVSSHCLLTIFILSSCASANRVDNLAYPIESIHQVVRKNLPGNLSRRSPNGREYYSGAFKLPFKYRNRQSGQSGKVYEKAYAKITILGETRPYSLEVEILVYEIVDENSSKPRYAYSHRQRDMEKSLVTKMRDQLVKRSKSRSTIDEFRAF